MNTTETIQEPKKSITSNLTFQILVAMVIGALLGIYIHNNYVPDDAKGFSDKIKMLATIEYGVKNQQYFRII